MLIFSIDYKMVKVDAANKLQLQGTLLVNRDQNLKNICRRQYMVIKMYNHTGINRKGPRIEPCGTPFDNGDLVFLFSKAEGT